MQTKPQTKNNQGIMQIFREVRNILLDRYAVKSYSQEGEDRILQRTFESRKKGFYIDVGAHHPRRFSNTYYFYKKGWSGINIDAMPGSMKIFNLLRPRDINLEVAISNDEREINFLIFNDPALNSFSDEAEHINATKNYYVKEKRVISTKKLENVLINHIPKNQKIDFLSIDVEGLDLEVLHSNNWELFRPEYILIECWGLDLKDIQNNHVYNFLTNKGYAAYAKTVKTFIFKDEQRDS